MRFALLTVALPLLSSLTLLGCAETTPDDEATASAASDVTESAHRECVIDTIFTEKGLLADLRGAVGPSFIKDYGPSFYPHIEIPGVFDAALAPNDELGEWFYTVVGLGIEPEELPKASTARPRLTAVLHGVPVNDPLLTTGVRTYAAAKAIFGAMTRATETKEEHIVSPHEVYDRSWVKTTRASAGRRVVCTKTVYPDAATQEPDVTCTFFGVERTSVQIFNTVATGGKCLAETR